MNDTSNQIIIFDTTLRDGEQSLQSGLLIPEKIQIAEALDKLGVDYIEAGFPVSSPGDFKAVNEISKRVKNSRVCGLARAVDKDIEACAMAMKDHSQFRIHTFLATSEIHLQKKLKISWEDAIEKAKWAVKYARNFCDDVEFSCEDAGRTDPDKLCEIIEAVIDAGASTVNIPDTVGHCLPTELGQMVNTILTKVPNSHKAVLSVHCHNDMGLAVANSLSAVQAGARQVEVTVNGIGERAGNCSLEELSLILETRKQDLPYKTNIDLKEIYPTSQLVMRTCNIPIQPNKAVVGSNAFSHSSGIHQDGVLKDRETYEILNPEKIGVPSGRLFMTPRSGRHVIKHRLQKLGIYKDELDLNSFYQTFTKVADKKGKVFDYDLEAIYWLGEDPFESTFSLSYLQVVSGLQNISTATIGLKSGNHEYKEAATGVGPVDAVFKAIDRVLKKSLTLLHYQIISKGEGKDAFGEVELWVKFENRQFHGKATSIDIVEASANAYLMALNDALRSSVIERKQMEKEVLERGCYV